MVVEAFKAIRNEISLDSPEDDVRNRLIKYFVEGTLGFRGKDYIAEKNRTDIRIYDETHNLVLVVVETKNPSVDLSQKRWQDQAFGYSDAFTKFVVLTNGWRLVLWRRANRSKPIVDLDFEAILTQKRFTSELLTASEKGQVASLWELTKDNLWSESKYADFTVTEKADISQDVGFHLLIEKVDVVIDNILMPYTVSAFQDYTQGYRKFKTERDRLSEEAKRARAGASELQSRYEKEMRDLEDRNARFRDFHRSYTQWLDLSTRVDDDDSKEAFCKETIYVLLNKILLARICEDKGLSRKKLSNNGIAQLQELFEHLKSNYKDLLDFVYKELSQLYSHVFESSIFDWYSEGNGDLNRALNRVLFIFNHFDFGHVDRDILGKLYERYLPKEERLKLGEFYTPENVIEYILNAAGYTATQPIEGKDVLDPACGSGGFLVRALNRLVQRYRDKGLEPKEVLTNAIGHIYGFDINPFACHITEMNLLFQTIDLYRQAKETDPSFKLPRFNIYQTNSLELPKDASMTRWQYEGAMVEKFLQERESIDRLKRRKFDFVVGNPPYVRVQRLPLDFVTYLKKEYSETADKRMDLYVVFVQYGISLLREGGKLGYIVSDQFTMATYGEKLRRFLLDKCTILQFVDFRDTPVFEELTNYPAILILSRGAQSKTEITCVSCYKSEDNLLEHIQASIGEKQFKTDAFATYQVPQSELSEKPWMLMPIDSAKVFNKIKNHNLTLGSVCKVRYGSITGKDEILVPKKLHDIDEGHVEIQIGQGKPVLVERRILHHYVKGRDVERWMTKDSPLAVFFPYKHEGGKTKLLSEIEFKTRFPEAHEALLPYRTKLEARKDSRGTMKQHGREWFSLVRAGDIAAYKTTKILSRYLSDTCKFTLYTDRGDDDYDVYASSVYGLTSEKMDLHALLGILNSKVAQFCMKHIAPPKAGGFGLYRANHLKRLPIRLPTSSREKRLVEEIGSLAKQSIALNREMRTSSKLSIEMIVQQFPTARLSDYPAIQLSIKSDKLAEVRRDKTRIHLSITDYIECGDILVAQYLERYLLEKRDDLVETENLRDVLYAALIPVGRDGISKVLDELDRLEAQTSAAPDEVKELEKQIDTRVFQLYGLNEKDAATIQSCL